MKTAELTGAALDWAVAKCEGVGVDIDDHSTCPIVLNTVEDMHFYGGWVFKPSFDWSQGGPIIEREGFDLSRAGRLWWVRLGDTQTFTGPTPLIAAMRCYVASKLGDTVEIPSELL